MVKIIAGNLTLASNLDCSCSIQLLHDLFHTVITSWSDQYHMASSLGTRPQKLRPTQLKCDRYIYPYVYIYIYILQTQTDYTPRLVASR